MHTKRRVGVWTAIVVAVCCFLAVREWRRQPDGRTHVSFLDVGQGDTTLVTSPSGKRVVIDGGPDWSALEKLGEELPFFERSIDMVVISHGHLDHIASLPELLQRYKVDVLVTSGIGNEGPWMRRVLSAAKANGTRVVSAVAGRTIVVDAETSFDVLWPPARLATQFTSNLNNVSVVLKLKSGTHSVLFSGDMEKMVEDTLVAARADLKSEILKVPHHGGKTSSSTGILLLTKPSIAVVSSGTGNSYGHPHPAVLRRMENAGIPVRRTDTEGTIRISW